MTEVSVVVLNYNYAHFLPDAIVSALRQTHRPAEVVVVDDASTDRSRAVIAEFGTDVVPVLHMTNRGQGAAINSGAAVTTGEVVWFLDADDMLLPAACAQAAAAFDRERGLAKFHTPLAIVDQDGRWSGGTLPADPTRLATGDIADHVFRYRAHGWPPMSGNAYSRRVLELVLPVPAETYRQAADSFLNEQVAICGPFARASEPVAAYRRHGDNQFAGTKLGLPWLRTKIEREVCSHERLAQVAERLDLDGYRVDVDDVEDVAFLGYRLASLRLDPTGHPRVGTGGPDRRFRLAKRGALAALANRALAPTDRVRRAVWFVVVAIAPSPLVRWVLDAYLPDGPSEPIWRRRRFVRRRRLELEATVANLRPMRRAESEDYDRNHNDPGARHG
ncbi:MAG: glycosyltransferase family A protein [Actinomycetota bacterium]